MDSPIKLIVEADEPALFYKDVKYAEIDLEAIDVHNGDYRALYGPNGEIYSIATTGDHIERVVISRADDQPDDPEALGKVLRNFLSAVRIAHSESDPLEELLRLCEPYAEPAIRRMGWLGRLRKRFQHGG